MSAVTYELQTDSAGDEMYWQHFSGAIQVDKQNRTNQCTCYVFFNTSGLQDVISGRTLLERYDNVPTYRNSCTMQVLSSGVAHVISTAGAFIDINNFFCVIFLASCLVSYVRYATVLVKLKVLGIVYFQLDV